MNQFYEKNHQQYFKSTVDIDPAAFLTPLTVFSVIAAANIFPIWYPERSIMKQLRHYL